MKVRFQTLPSSSRNLLLALSLAMVSCGDDSAPTLDGGSGTTGDAPVCNAGEQVDCTCEDAAVDGTKTCAADGLAWSECMCEGDPPNPTGDVPSPPQCGNGVVEGSEDCDDGNDDDDDACSNACVAACCMVWEKTFGLGTSPGDSITDVAVDGAGYVHVAGVRELGGNSFDVWVSKLDPQGEELWSYSYDHGYGGDAASWLGVTGDGGVMVAGTVFGYEHRQPWVGRLDAEGEPVWELALDAVGGLSELVADGALAADGVVLVSTAGIDDLDDDVVVSRIDAAGSVVWRRTLDDVTIGSRSIDYASSVAVRPDGRIVVLGGFEIDYDTQDARVIQLDANGDGPSLDVTLWSTPEAHDHDGCGLEITDDGHVIAAVRRLGGTKDSSFRLFELDPAGDVVWEAGPTELELEPGGHRCVAFARDLSGDLVLLAKRPSNGLDQTGLLEILHLDADRQEVCHAWLDEPMPEVGPQAASISGGGTVIHVAGSRVFNQAQQPWLARFRG